MIKVITIGKGLMRIMMWETDAGWRYDGPASAGPKHVRESGRGPHWRGPVDKGHVDDVVKRAEKLGLEIS